MYVSVSKVIKAIIETKIVAPTAMFLLLKG
jgi:hypothetical protein